MFRKKIGTDEGLLLDFGYRDSRLDSSITMLFVPFELSVIWINSRLEVADKVLAKPWRPAYFSAEPARFVLEIHPEHLEDYQVGDILEFTDA